MEYAAQSLSSALIDKALYYALMYREGIGLLNELPGDKARSLNELLGDKARCDWQSLQTFKHDIFKQYVHNPYPPTAILFVA